MQGRLDHTEGNGVYAQTARGVLDRKRAGGRNETPLGQDGQRRWSAAIGMFDKRRRNIDHVPAALVEHVLDGSRRDVKETSEVDGDQGVEVLEGVIREGLADVDPRVVDQSVDPAKAPDRLVDNALRRVRVRYVTGDGNDAGVLGWLDR
jgi:hypothetical protein